MNQEVNIPSVDNNDDVHHVIDYEKQLLLLQRDILEAIATDNSHDEHLNALCLAAENMLPNSVASIMLYDKTRSFLLVRAAPSIPQAAVDELNGLVPSECAGSCGTAVFSKFPVFVENTATDQRWLMMRDFASQYGIESCWSNPIKIGNDQVLGSFALSSFESRAPTELQQNLLSTCAYLAGLVLQREKMEQSLWHKANIDALTLLPNRELFNLQLEQALEETSGNELKVALMFIDLDNFKDINDSYGHSAGDEVLVALATAIKECVGEHAMLARTGGDEFVVILKDLTEQTAADVVAKKILYAAKNIEHSQNIETTLSIGICIYPDDADSSDTLLRNADTAMYAAKSSGKNNFCHYKPELTEEILKKLTLSNELRTAIQSNQLVLYYQPIYNSDGNSINSVETLIRWNHPERGLLAPNIFIPVAEETSLINDITLWVISTVCETSKAWIEQSYDLKSVSVNLSASEINQETFDRIINILEKTQFPPECLELEITETMLIQQGQTAIEQLQRMRDYGLSIALDDFGTGYSSLYQIHRLPINKLKIDRAFITDIPTNINHTKLTNLIIAMAKNFDLEVVAEGVETEAQRDYLIEQGCDLLQGYLLGKPMPEDQFLTLL